MTSSDAVTSVFHYSVCLSNLLVKRIDSKLCVSQNLKKMLCLIIHRVYKMLVLVCRRRFPLQLGVVLVYLVFFFSTKTMAIITIHVAQFCRKIRPLVLLGPNRLTATRRYGCTLMFCAMSFHVSVFIYSCCLYLNLLSGFLKIDISHLLTYC